MLHERFVSASVLEPGAMGFSYEERNTCMVASSGPTVAFTCALPSVMPPEPQFNEIELELAATDEQSPPARFRLLTLPVTICVAVSVTRTRKSREQCGYVYQFHRHCPTLTVARAESTANTMNGG